MTMMPRNPRREPQPGDALERDGLRRTVKTVEPSTFDRTRRTRITYNRWDGQHGSGHVCSLAAWRRWAATATVVEVKQHSKLVTITENVARVAAIALDEQITALKKLIQTTPDDVSAELTEAEESLEVLLESAKIAGVGIALPCGHHKKRRRSTAT